MADIQKALPILYKAEFSNANDALEINPTENGWTFMGIYQGEHPTWSGWAMVRQKMQQYNNDRKLVSSMLYDNERMREYVEFFYKREFWDKAKLNKVTSQHTANEIFIFGVVSGMGVAIKAAQELLGVVSDGWVGEKTIKALNAYDENLFDIKFDEEEIEHFRAVVASKPQKARFLNGWINRAHLV